MAARKEFTDEQKRLAVVMYRCGENMQAIAQRLGCTRQTLMANGVLDEIPAAERRERMGNRAKGSVRRNQTKPAYVPTPHEIKHLCEKIRRGWPKARIRHYEQQRARIPMLRERDVFTGNKAASY